MFMNLKDWKQAVRTPPAYRVGNSTLRIQTQFVAIITLVGFLTLIVIYRSTDREKVQKVVGYGIHDLDKVKIDYAKSGGRSNELTVYDFAYNSTYPLTRPVKVHDALQFRIALVTDLDHSSSSKLESNTWVSYMMKGYLMWTPASYGVSITWDKPTMTTLKSTYGHSGRGMELSELVTYDGKLLTFDDRSGIVYVIDKEKVYPWVILLDGDGKVNKGFKSEWATVKDQCLYVGGMGKEWTTSSGEFVNTNPMWVKRVSRRNSALAMMKFSLIVLVAVVGVVLGADEKYTTKYDNINLDEILNNERMYRRYVDCIKTGEKCTPDAKLLREVLPDALQTGCSKCSDKQKAGSEKVIKFLLDKHPDDFKELEKMFDPNHAYRKNFPELAKRIGLA